jgi:hypothetical protein
MAGGHSNLESLAGRRAAERVLDRGVGARHVLGDAAAQGADISRRSRGSRADGNDWPADGGRPATVDATPLAAVTTALTRDLSCC